MNKHISINNCQLCQRIKLIQDQKDPNLIHEFDGSYLLLGSHQFFKGYLILITKDHIREPFELTPELQTKHFEELMFSSKILQLCLNPWKINYSCFGNQVPHLHWHLFPRYFDDPDRLEQPWLHQDKFKSSVGTVEERQQTIALITEQINKIKNNQQIHS